MSAGADSLKSILFALGANFLIALAKTGGAIFTGSSSMLAEAIHSYADCANQGLLLWGLREGRRRPDRDHPLGHGKAIYFWSFIVALMLFSMGGLFSIYEGVHKLQATEPVDERLGRDRHPRVRHRRRERLALGVPARGQQGPRRARAVALVPQLAPERAARRLRRGHRRARRPDAGARLHLRWRTSPATRRGTLPARSASACCSCSSRCSSASR